MPQSDHPGRPGDTPDHRTAQAPTGDTRQAGLRRLSALTAATAVAAVAATGVVAVAAYHASRPAAGQDGLVGPASADVAGDATDGEDQLRGPDQAPRRGGGAPAGVSSGS